MYRARRGALQVCIENPGCSLTFAMGLAIVDAVRLFDPRTFRMNILSRLTGIFPDAEDECEKGLRRRAGPNVEGDEVPIFGVFMSSSQPRPLFGRNPAVVSLLAGVIVLGGCTTVQERVSQRENDLAAAGFEVRPANTPERQAMLNKLPPHRFVQRVHGSTISYVYADPLVCDCLYVGSQPAYDRYRLYMQQKRLVDEQEMAAEMWSDPGWNWGAWGPWGPGYGFGAGPGW